LNGGFLRKKNLDSGALKIFDFFVPLFRFLENNFLKRKIGISLIIILEK
jgi:hypothetical protein